MRRPVHFRHAARRLSTNPPSHAHKKGAAGYPRSPKKLVIKLTSAPPLRRALWLCSGCTAPERAQWPGRAWQFFCSTGAFPCWSASGTAAGFEAPTGSRPTQSTGPVSRHKRHEQYNLQSAHLPLCKPRAARWSGFAPVPDQRRRPKQRQGSVREISRLFPSNAQPHQNSEAPLVLILSYFSAKATNTPVRCSCKTEYPLSTANQTAKPDGKRPKTGHLQARLPCLGQGFGRAALKARPNAFQSAVMLSQPLFVPTAFVIGDVFLQQRGLQIPL